MPEKKEKKEIIQSPKGMRDIFEPDYFTYQGFFEKASEIAMYYGFKPIELPILEPEELFLSSVGEGTDIIDKEMYTLKTKGGDKLAMRPEGTAGVMRSYIENGLNSQPQPVMLFYYGPFFRHEKPQRGRLRELRQFGLEILGTSKSIADATTIMVTLTILKEMGLKNLCVHINSIGDKESRPQFTRELISYYKKNLSTICTNCKQRLKTNPLRVLDCKTPKCQPIKDEAPDFISLLAGEAKQHFKEVLEYLDAMGVEYRINNHLVRGLDYYTKTVFEIVQNPTGDKCDEKCDDASKEGAEETPEPLALAGGGRYDDLAKKLGSKKEVPAMGASIGVDRVIMQPDHQPISPRILKQPKVFFIQLGFEAKLKCLEVIEILRQAKIPVQQSLTKDKLSGQLGLAEKLNIPFTIILGQREALDKTVIVRDMMSRSQETIPIDTLAAYLKKHIK